MMEEVLVPMFFFATTFGVVYLYLTSRNRERMALIERGADMDKFYNRTHQSYIIKFAFLLLGSGIGIIIGFVMIPFFPKGYGYEEGVVIALTLIFGGLFLVIGHFVEFQFEKMKNKNTDLMR